MSEKKLNIAFIPAWYPSKKDEMFGLFVKNHALAIKNKVQLIVIAAVSDGLLSKTREVEISCSEELVEIIIYYRPAIIYPISPLINGFRYFNSLLKAWKILLLKYGKPDLCHVHVLTRAGVFALFLKITQKIPYVITEHWSRYFSFNNSYKGILRKWATKLVVKNASVVSTVSLALKNAMNERGLYNSNWKILPNSIDTNLFSLHKNIKSDSKVRCFHISCFEEASKNMSGILRAFNKALLQKPDMELYMIGDGDDMEATKRLAKDLNIEDKVIFTGVLQGDMLIKVVNKCDFSILFSNYETFAIVIAESLSAGKPVIATNVGAIPEVLPSEFGVLINPDDEKALTDSILQMSEDYSNYDENAMHDFVVERFSKEKVAEKIIKLYKDTLYID